MKKIAFYVCIGLFLVSTLNAVHRGNKVEVCPSGYAFHAAYKVNIPHEEVIVEAEIGRSTLLCKSRLGRLPRAPFMRTKLHVVHNGRSGEVTALKKDHCPYKIEKIKRIERSLWDSHIKNLLKKLVKTHYKADTLKYPKNSGGPEMYLRMHVKAYSRKSIEPLAGCKLDTAYSLHAALPQQQRMVVTISTSIENYRGKQMVASTVNCTTELEEKKTSGTWTTLKSQMKFMQTKNGLQVLSKENLDPTSKWYQSVKSVVRKSMKQYAKLKHLHENMCLRKQETNVLQK